MPPTRRPWAAAALWAAGVVGVATACSVAAAVAAAGAGAKAGGASGLAPTAKVLLNTYSACTSVRLSPVVCPCDMLFELTWEGALPANISWVVLATAPPADGSTAERVLLRETEFPPESTFGRNRSGRQYRSIDTAAPVNLLIELRYGPGVQSLFCETAAIVAGLEAQPRAYPALDVTPHRSVGGSRAAAPPVYICLGFCVQSAGRRRRGGGRRSDSLRGTWSVGGHTATGALYAPRGTPLLSNKGRRAPVATPPQPSRATVPH